MADGRGARAAGAEAMVLADAFPVGLDFDDEPFDCGVETAGFDFDEEAFDCDSEAVFGGDGAFATELLLVVFALTMFALRTDRNF